jgi:hypothetical protein
MLDLFVARAECACQASKVIHKLDGLPSCFGAAEDQKSWEQFGEILDASSE